MSERTDVLLGQTHLFRCPPLLLAWEWDAAGSCLLRALTGIDIVDEGEGALAGSDVVEHKYGWYRFLVMVFAPEPEARAS